MLTREYDCGCDVETPAGIAELGFGDLAPVAPPAELPTACRSDLLGVDGVPVPVRLVGTTADAVRLGAVHVARCDDPPAPPRTALGAGRHVASSAPGGATGLDVDRLVWSSASGGGPGPDLAIAGTIARTRPAAGPHVKVVRSGRASLTAEVTRAQGPFWLVLGQSQNAGWRATVGGRSLGESTLVDGYANGWLIGTNHANVTIELEWIPERTVERSLALSIVSVILCLGIVLASSRRDRIGAAAAILDAGDPVPTFRWPWDERPSRARLVTAIATGIVMAAFGAVAVRPVLGVALGILVVAAMVRPRIRAAMMLVPAVFLTAAAGYIAIRQARRHLPPIFEWPTFFFRARTIAWVAIVVLAADAVIEIVLSRRRDRGPRRD